MAALILQISHVGLREGIDKPSVPQPVKGKPPPGEHVQAGPGGRELQGCKGSSRLLKARSPWVLQDGLGPPASRGS